MEYKGYHTKVGFDAESMTLRGTIEGINDYVDFEADSIASVEEEFHAAVDDYIEFCATVGKEPEREYKGTFNIRISPELHRKLALRAFADGRSLNSEVEIAIESFVYNSLDQTEALAESVRELTNTIRIDRTSYENETTVNSESNIYPFGVTYVHKDEVKTL